MKPLPPRTALITGGASGLGRLLALSLARQGVRVTAWDRDGAGLARLEAEARAEGWALTGLVCDLADRTQVAARAAETGPVDLLVNNAGVVSGKTLLETSDEQIERTFAVNTLALFWTTKAFLPAMLEADRVVKVVLRAVRRGRRRVILPWFVYSVLWLRGLPSAALDFLADLFGINHAMDRFTGRPAAQEKQK